MGGRLNSTRIGAYQLSGVATSVSEFELIYQQIGNTIVIGGQLGISTNASGNFGFELSLPSSVTTNFSAATDGGGTFATSDGKGYGRVIAQPGTTNLKLQGNTNIALSGQGFFFNAIVRIR